MILHIIKFIFSKQYRKQSVVCGCGMYEKCVRKIRVNDGGYFGNTKLYVDNKDHFRCGKVQEQIKKMTNAFKNENYT